MHEMKLHKKTLDIPDTKCIFSALELLMKNIFLFLGLLVCSLPAFSQTRSNTISWETEANSSSFASSLSALDRTASAKKNDKRKSVRTIKA